MMDEELGGFYGQPSGNKSAWMITFADLLSLMLTFFVLLYAISQVTRAQWEEVVRSLQQRLNPERMVEFTMTMSEDNIITKRERPTGNDLDYVYTILGEKLKKVKGSDVTLRRMDDRIVVSLASDMLFSPGSADIHPKGERALQLVSDAVGALNNKITVAGHTDPTPIHTSAYPSNRELSLARAQRVTERIYASGYLFPIEAFGMSDSRFDEIRGTAETRKRLARRVDIDVRAVTP